MKGELYTILMIEVLISNGTPMLLRFWIGESRMSGVHSSPIVRSASVAPSLGEAAPPLDLLVESLEVKMMNRRLLLLDLLVPSSLIVLLVSFACKFFLDHPQNFRVCLRGSRPSPVRG